MTFELRDGQGTLFKNDKKGNEKAPDYRGEAKISGEIWRVAGWLKDGKKGKWMSLQLEPPGDAPSDRRENARPTAGEDIPF